MDKSLIINEIKKHLGFKKDIDLAAFLEISQSTLSSWHRRGSINYELIITKCKDIDANWLLTGEGEMLKKNSSPQLSDSLLKDFVELQKKHIKKLESEIEEIKSKIQQKDSI